MSIFKKCFFFTFPPYYPQEYKKARSSSLDIAVSLEAEYAGYGGSFGYKDSRSAQSAKSFFESGESVMMISTTDCLLYDLRISPFQLPGSTILGRLEYCRLDVIFLKQVLNFVRLPNFSLNFE